MWKFIKWLFILVILLLVVVFIGLPLLANTEEGRKQLAKVLSDATNREVSLGELKVGLFYSSVDVGDLRIKNPEGFEGDFLNAGELNFDAKLQQLLEGRVVGGLKGEGLDITIVKKNGRTNLEGFGGAEEKKKDDGGEPAPEPKDDGGEKEPAKEKKGPDMDLMLELTDSKVTIKDLDKNETLVLEGVSLDMKLTNKKGEQDTGVKIRIKAIEGKAITVKDLQIDATQKGDYLDLTRLVATLPGQGGLTGNGRLRVKGGDDWTVKLKATDVAIQDDMMPLIASVCPMAVSKTKGQVQGNIGAEFDIRGNGLTWEAMKPTLDGTGKVTMTDLNLPSGSMLVEATQFAAKLSGKGGDGGPMKLKNAGAQFAVKDGWLNFNRLSASGDRARYDLAGRVSLDGRLDLTMDLAPLVKQFKVDPKVGKYLEDLPPMKIQGTADQPKYKLPKPDEIAKAALKGAARDKINEGVGKLFDKLNKKKRD